MSQQSTKTEASHAPAEIPQRMSLRELTELLVRHYGFHEGLYDVALEFQVAVGAVGPKQELLMPGAMIGVSRVGIVKSETQGPHTVDAAIANPLKKTRTKVKP